MDVSATEFTTEEHAIEQKQTLPRFLFFPIGTLALIMLAINRPIDHWAVQVFWTAVASYSLFCWTSCFHETAHQALCGSRWFSIWLGRAIGTVLLVPYTAYRESHIRHHAYLNKPRDWELWPYSDPSTSAWFRRIFCWLEIPFGLFTSPFVYGRLYLLPNSPLTNAKLKATIRNEYAGMAVCWACVLGAVSYFSVWPIFLQAWVVPHCIAGVFQTIRKFTEHLGMQSYDPLLGARTVIGRGLVSRCCSYLNFDIFVHGPHHRHARVAHDRLIERMEHYQAQHPDLPFPVFDTYWAAMRHMAPSMLFNPGVGMNAGAATPRDEKDADVESFVYDVTSEVLADRDAAVSHRAGATQLASEPRSR